MFAVNGAFPQISAVVLMTLAARRVVDIAYVPYKSKKPVKEQGHRISVSLSWPVTIRRDVGV